MLSIKGLKVKVEDVEILHGVDLEIKPGEIHVIMGPNGSGKSTLASVLMGSPRYEITEGSVAFLGKDLLEMDPEERAVLGLFLSFQYPKEIPGVNLVSFMRASYNAVRKAQTEARSEMYEPISLFKFKQMVMELMSTVGMPVHFMNRATNEGFSGGEKKKSEILQMAMLEPKLAVLDEVDSGLDIDALKNICQTIQAVRKEDQSLLLITHYQRILNYIMPDVIHVMMEGKIVMSGGKDLAKTLEEKGYDYVREHVGLKKKSLLKMTSV